MKVKKYTCSIKNDEFHFMNFRSIITFINLKNDKKAYFVNTSINFLNFQVNLISSSKSVKIS